MVAQPALRWRCNTTLQRAALPSRCGPHTQPHHLQQQPRAPLVTRRRPASGDAGGFAPGPNATELVDRVLTAIEGTDSGDNMTPAARQEVDGWLQQLDAIGEHRVPRPLDDPLIWGNYEVAYVSSGSRQNGQPAGGRFRSGLGKLLFRTTFLGQSVLQPDVVTNKVEFKLLNVLPGSVGLRGRFVAIDEDGADRRDLVKVFFDPPCLSLPAGIHIRIGPESSVVLKTQFVDDRVRLGKGSRGSLFVFTRGGRADAAAMDQVGLQQLQPLGNVLLWGMVAALMVNGTLLAAGASLPPIVRAAGAVQVLLGVALGGVVYRGGIEADNDDRPDVKPVPAA